MSVIGEGWVRFKVIEWKVIILKFIPLKFSIGEQAIENDCFQWGMR